ncbi:MAG: pyruvate kinase [Phycisphaerales bacterium JB038]
MADRRSAEAKPTLNKIIATVGPACESEEMLAKLAEAGVSLFRLNFSHGSLDDHARNLQRLRRVEAQIERPIGVIGDLSGPKMRIREVSADGIHVETGSDVAFERGEGPARPGKPPVFTCTYARLIDEVEVGHKILINDGAVRMLAVGKEAERLTCRVLVGGLVTSGKGINLPNSDLSAPALTEKDERCLDWAIEHGIDYVALSFVRRAEDILLLKERIVRQACCQVDHSSPFSTHSAIPVSAKIERPEAIEHIDDIVEAADGIMVARGDLGVEMDLAEVPVIQKRILQRCGYHGKPCIVATQMLQTMIDSPIPTRAEASDVANAIYDGADAVMLSGETAVGKYPQLAVETMSRIAQRTEEHRACIDVAESAPGKAREAADLTAAIAGGAWSIARDVRAELVICWSQQGSSARFLSQNSFHIPIIAFSNSISALRRMALLRGVTPQRLAAPSDLATFITAADEIVQEAGWAQAGDPVVFVMGEPLGIPGETDRLLVHRIGAPVRPC